MKHIVSKKNRVLLAELVRTDFKLRYQGSVLGYAWSLLRPLFLFIILYVVFVKFLRVGSNIEHYPVYLLLGIVIWGFFNEMTTQSLQSIVARGELIRKIKIPRWIIVVSSSVSALINLFLNLIVIVVFMVINKVEVGSSALLFPLALIHVYVFSLGVSFFLSAAYVKYRDLGYIWEIVLQAGFYATPILYPLQLVTNETVQKFLLMNPVATAIQSARDVLVTKEAITAADLFGSNPKQYIPVAITVVITIISALYFRSQSKSFAENI